MQSMAELAALGMVKMAKVMAGRRLPTYLSVGLVFTFCQYLDKNSFLSLYGFSPFKKKNFLAIYGQEVAG